MDNNTELDVAIRAHLEGMEHNLLGPAKVLSENNIKHTIALFGSATTQTEEEAETNLAKVQEEFNQSKERPQELWGRLEKAENLLWMTQFYKSAEELSFKISEWSNQFKKPEDQFIVCTGGGPGIMEASNRGANRANARTIGLNINIPLEQDTNRFVTPELNFCFEYFFLRKFWFFYHVKAIVVFPGGFGTLDELFEVLTLIKTHKLKRYIPIVLFGSKYWKEVLNLEPMFKYGTLKREDVDFLKYFDCVDEAFEHLTQELSTHYVKDSK